MSADYQAIMVVSHTAHSVRPYDWRRERMKETEITIKDIPEPFFRMMQFIKQQANIRAKLKAGKRDGGDNNG